MEKLTVLLAENDTTVAAALAASLDGYFHSVKVVHSLAELKSAIPKMHANAVVADLETISLDDISDLRRQFQLPIVCTHRVPDEKLWTAAMEAGALDVCEKNDAVSMVRALQQTRSFAA